MTLRRPTTNLIVIDVPAFSEGAGDAILHAVTAQFLIATLSEDAGLPVCEFRYRQTDTKLADTKMDQGQDSSTEPRDHRCRDADPCGTISP